MTTQRSVIVQNAVVRCTIVNNQVKVLAVQGATSGGGSSGAPVGASYVVLSADGTLTSERVLTAGTGITVTDGGAGSAATIAANFGTIAGTVAQGNDARLSDTRTPTDGSVTNAKVAAGAAIAGSKLAQPVPASAFMHAWANFR